MGKLKKMIITKTEPINHKHDLRKVYYIKTNEWFKDIQFLNKERALKFLKEELNKKGYMSINLKVK